MNRIADIRRKTAETDIKLLLNLDGKGIYDIDSGVPFFNHMLEQFSKHSHFDLIFKAKGDTEVDLHHLIEDTGIVIGSALKESSGDKRGIRRFGSASIPMDETLVNAACDFSGRSFFVFNFGNKDMAKTSLPKSFKGYKNPNHEALKEILVDKFFYVYSSIFFEALCKNALITLHINVTYGHNAHHIVEAIFKSVGIAFSNALEFTGVNEVPSTKGSI